MSSCKADIEHLLFKRYEDLNIILFDGQYSLEKNYYEVKVQRTIKFNTIVYMLTIPFLHSNVSRPSYYIIRFKFDREVSTEEFHMVENGMVALLESFKSKDEFANITNEMLTYILL